MNEYTTEVAGMVGTAMYVKIQELRRKGYKKQRAARELGIDTKTVRKYWEMTEAEYSTYLLETKERSKIMDPYRDFVLEQLRNHSEITSAIIYDHLLEISMDLRHHTGLYGCMYATFGTWKGSRLRGRSGSTAR